MSYGWNWSVFLDRPTPRETYLDWILSGLALTLGLGLAAWCIALVLGIALGICRTAPSHVLSGLAWVYVEVFRNVPLIVQLFIWYFVVPELLPAEAGRAVKRLNPFAQQFLAAVLCLGTFVAARICEQVRSGIEALPRGQRSAGLALGLTLPQTYRYVLLPVAFRIIVPPLTSEFLNTFKNTAVASTIGLLELAAQGRQLVDYTSQPYEAFIVVTLLYLAVNLGVMGLMRRFERRLRLPGHVVGTRT